MEEDNIYQVGNFTFWKATVNNIYHYKTRIFKIRKTIYRLTPLDPGLKKIIGSHDEFKIRKSSFPKNIKPHLGDTVLCACRINRKYNRLINILQSKIITIISAN